MPEKTPMSNAQSTSKTCEKSETIPENTPLKRTVILIYLGFLFLAILFVGFVAKNKPQQPTWMENIRFRCPRGLRWYFRLSDLFLKTSSWAIKP